jgi:hypothetical protein
MSDSLSISTDQVSVMVIRKKKKTLQDITVNRDPALMAEDHQSWLIWWLVENRPEGMAQWWYVLNDLGDGSMVMVGELENADFLTNGTWNIIQRNYKTLGGISGYGNYFVVSQSGDVEWESARHLGQEERDELMSRLVAGYKDETIGVEVDYQFFLENDGWYLAEQPNEDNHVSLFYRGSSASNNEIVVKVASDLMPNGVTTVSRLTHNDIDTDTFRFLTESDSWILPSKVLEVLNWSRFPTVFLE